MINGEHASHDPAAAQCIMDDCSNYVSGPLRLMRCRRAAVLMCIQRLEGCDSGFMRRLAASATGAHPTGGQVMCKDELSVL